MCLMGCLSMICLTAPADATTAEQQAIADQIFLAWVEQQAFCNSIRGRQKPPVTLPPACFGAMYRYKLGSGLGGMTARAEVTSGFLPDGMFLSDPSAGAIYLTGAPTASGTFGFTIKISSPLKTTVTSYLLNVTLLTVAPPGMDNVLADATIGTPYTATFNPVSYAVAPVSWQVVSGALPPGLSLNEATGVVSGTPTGSAASYFFTILLQDHAV